MIFIQWGEHFKTGDQEIDSHHEFIVSLINQLYDKRMVEEHEEVFQLICELEEYANTHFFSEENLLEAIRYPKIEVHKQLHHIFRTKIRMIKESYSDSRSAMIEDDIFQFLRHWWVFHITHEDAKYIPYLKP